MKSQIGKLLLPKAFIDGAWLDAASGRTFEVLDPATNHSIARVADAGVDEARAAIRAASEAQRDWKSRPAEARAAALRAWRGQILQIQEELAHLITSESGKPLSEARGEVLYGAAYLDFYASEATRIMGELIPSAHADRRILVLKQPVGVVGVITPWNFPMAMVARKVAPALAAGCTVVVKPAEDTPLSALALAAAAETAGIPPGVFNVVPCQNPEVVGEILSTDPAIQKISFTGSTEVGRLLLSQAAQTVKSATMELGGDAPFIVFDDADLEAAVSGAVESRFRNAGQTCVCANRIFVQNAIAAEFTERFAKRVAGLKVGPGLAHDTQIGPLVNSRAVAKMTGLLEDASAKGASILVGGRPQSECGNFFDPTVILGTSSDMDIAGSEIFGPIAQINTFENESEVIERANDTPYGLAAYLFTRDAGRIWRMSEALEFGQVGVNAGVISSEAAPFGGMKQSGLGREGSRHGIDEYLELKYVCQAGLEAEA